MPLVSQKTTVGAFGFNSVYRGNLTQVYRPFNLYTFHEVPSIHWIATNVYDGAIHPLNSFSKQLSENDSSRNHLQKIATQCVHVWALLLSPNGQSHLHLIPSAFPNTPPPPLLCTFFSSPIHQSVFI